LLLCFNEQLGRFLAIDALETAKRVKVSTVHRFMTDVIRQAGLAMRLGSAASRSELFDDVYPNLFESAATALLEQGELPQFDVLIVDEAQDVLNAPMMNCLDLVLDKGFNRGSWLIFFDPSFQSDIYNRMSKDVLTVLRQTKPAEFFLWENF